MNKLCVFNFWSNKRSKIKISKIVKIDCWREAVNLVILVLVQGGLDCDGKTVCY